MNEVKFPSYWGPKGGDPILVKDALSIEEGWIEHFGHYDVQIGQWVPQEAPSRAENYVRSAEIEGISPLDRDAKDGPGGSLPRNVPKLKAIAKAENIDLGGARKADEIQAIILKARSS